jgi:hypothetical protein
MYVSRYIRADATTLITKGQAASLTHGERLLRRAPFRFGSSFVYHGPSCRTALSSSRADACAATSRETQAGKRLSSTACFPEEVCTSRSCARCGSGNRSESLTSAGHRRRCTYVIFPSMSRHTSTSGLSRIARVSANISRPRVRPPTSADRLPGNGRDQRRHRPTAGLQHQSVRGYKSECLCGCQARLSFGISTA